MGHISLLPEEILHNIFVRLPISLLVNNIKYVCKSWNRVISDPCYLKSWPTGDRKILVSFKPVDVLEENDDTTRSMVPFEVPKFQGKVTFAGSCNGIVLLVIDYKPFTRVEHTRMILYNPLTGAKKQVPDDLHSECSMHGPSNYKHIYGFGFGSSTPDDVKIVRFRGCEYSFSSSAYDNRHTCDVFSPKTNSWTMLKKFVPYANRLDNVGTFVNGSLYWINNVNCKIVALDVNNMVLSYIHVRNEDGLSYTSWSTCAVMGTLNGCLCVVDQSYWSTAHGSNFTVWVMEKGKSVENPWQRSSFNLKLKSEFGYSPINILDDGIILTVIPIHPLKKLVIYDVFKHWHQVINISETHNYFQTINGIEYVESLVSPSTLFNA